MCVCLARCSSQPHQNLADDLTASPSSGEWRQHAAYVGQEQSLQRLVIPTLKLQQAPVTTANQREARLKHVTWRDVTTHQCVSPG